MPPGAATARQVQTYGPTGREVLLLLMGGDTLRIRPRVTRCDPRRLPRARCDWETDEQAAALLAEGLAETAEQDAALQEEEEEEAAGAAAAAAAAAGMATTPARLRELTAVQLRVAAAPAASTDLEQWGYAPDTAMHRAALANCGAHGSSQSRAGMHTCVSWLLAVTHRPEEFREPLAGLQLGMGAVQLFCASLQMPHLASAARFAMLRPLRPLLSFGGLLPTPATPTLAGAVR